MPIKDLRYYGGFESLLQQKSSCSSFHWDNRQFPFLIYNGIIFITAFNLTGFAIFSLVVEGSNIHGSSVEYLSLTLSFAVIMIGMTTLLSSFAAFFAASCRRSVNLLKALRTIFRSTVALNTVVFIFGIGIFRQVKELTYSIVEWTRVIKYYQEEHIRTDLDSIQRQLKCCGFKSYQDWDLNPYYSCNSTGYSRCSVPFSCCKLKNPSSSCVLGIRFPGTTQAKLREFIYLDGCLKTSEIWYKCTILLLSLLSILMAVFKGFLLYYLDLLITETQNGNSDKRRPGNRLVRLNSQEKLQESENSTVSKLDTIITMKNAKKSRRKIFRR